MDLGLEISDEDFLLQAECYCESCKSQKKLQHVLATAQDFSHYSPFEYICMDGSGPLPVASLFGNRYIWAIMCLKSRWVKLYCTKNKTAKDIANVLQKFLAWVKSKRGKIGNLGVTSRLLTDLGSEFKNKLVEEILVNEAIAHTFAATAMHHQNAHIERNFRTMWRMMNRCMFTGDVPEELWELLAHHTVYLRNRIGISSLDMDSPYLLRFGHESTDLKRCRVFYSPCWPVTDSYYTKFNASADECKWVGLSEETRGTIVYRPRDRKVFVAGQCAGGY